MKSKKLHFLTIALLFLSLLGFLSFTEKAAAEDQADGDKNWPIEIEIPYGSGQTLKKGNEVNIVQYLSVLYKFVTLALGIFAVVMFIIGGIQYLLAAGNTAAVASAKQTMLAALAGMIIILTAYSLLKIINKDLVELQDPGGTVSSD